MKTSKIIISLLLAAALLVTALPLTVFAADGEFAESGVSVSVNAVYHSDTQTVDVSWNSVSGAARYDIRLQQYYPEYEDYYTLPGTTYRTVTASEPLSCSFGDCFELYGYGTMDYRIKVDVYQDNIGGTKIASGTSAVFQTGIAILDATSYASIFSDGVCQWSQVTNAEYYEVLLYTKSEVNPKMLVANARVHQGIGKFLFSDKMKNGQEYFITVEAKRNGWRSRPATQSDAVPAAGLDLPSVTGFKWNVYTLSWNRIENASSYVLTVCRFTAGQWYEQYMASFETAETSMRLTDVFKRTGKYGYVVRIHAKDSQNRAVTLETDAPHKVYDPVAVSDAYCSIVTPKAGKHPDMNPVSGYGDKFSTKLDCWYLDESPYPVLTADDTFQAGKTYVIRVNYIPADGYYFDENTRFSVNGIEATRLGGWICMVKFTIPSEQIGVSLSGTAKSYLDDAQYTMLYLSQGQGGLPAVATVHGNDGSYSFQKVNPGSYTLTVKKKNHTTREYSLVLYDDMNMTVKINPIGDANLSGGVTSADSNAVYKHVLGSKKLTDPYGIKCGDVVGNNNGLTSADANSIYKHVLGTKKLY